MTAPVEMGTERHQGAPGEGGASAGEDKVRRVPAWAHGGEGKATSGHRDTAAAWGWLALLGMCSWLFKASRVGQAVAKYPQHLDTYEHKPVGFNQLMQNELYLGPAGAGFAG